MKILVAPLDWGLGHATRCIPVILELSRQGDEVIIAASGNIEQLLKLEFPLLKFVSLDGYHMKYSTFLPMPVSMLLQLPKMIKNILIEHRQLKNIIHEYKIDAVISDNRYGLWNKKIHSVFMTHQIMIKCPPGLRFLEPFLYRINKFFINKYDECWIPDDEKKLCGDLAHGYPLPSNARFIGPLSRWKDLKNGVVVKKYDVICMLSGPEPSRSSLEEILIGELTNSPLNALILLGKPGVHFEKKLNDNLRLVSHLESKKMLDAISSSELVICRPGYSSIMDLISINKNAILIPTPGQTEQIYLADYLRKKNVFFSMREKIFNLEKAVDEAKKYSLVNLEKTNQDLASFLANWRKKLSAY